MKRVLTILICIIGFASAAFAENQWYKSNSYAFKQVNSYGYWNNWSDWQPCNVNIKFDMINDRITIYSNVTQSYKITYYYGDTQDDYGGYQSYFLANEANGGRCTIRLRIEQNGNSQIYIEYTNAMWVYNVVRTK